MIFHLGKSISKEIHDVHDQVEKTTSQGDMNLGWQTQSLQELSRHREYGRGWAGVEGKARLCCRVQTLPKGIKKLIINPRAGQTKHIC